MPFGAPVNVGYCLTLRTGHPAHEAGRLHLVIRWHNKGVGEKEASDFSLASS